MAKPFVKWAGGKSQLIDDIYSVIPGKYTPNSKFTYVEPFVGGGAMLLHLLTVYPNMTAVINDMNHQLINCYRVIKDLESYKKFKEILREKEIEYNIALDNGTAQEEYILQRHTYNLAITGKIHRDDVELAALFVFINKTCFNGLYRVNKNGEFNVPWGNKFKKEVNLFDTDNIDEVHCLLQRVEIMEGDYKGTLKYAAPDTLFYMDPPYKPVSKTAFFNSYTKEAFDDDSQVELKEFCDKLDEAGADFIVSNSKVDNYFEELYDGYTVSVVSARRCINSRGDKRFSTSELLIYNGDGRGSSSVSLF